MNLKSIATFILIAFVSLAKAQVSFTAEASKTTLSQNEKLRVDFTMNQDGDNFNPPDFNGFRIFAGPNQSISNTWINGKSSYEKTFSYYLEPISTGTFTIGEAEITIDGQIYRTTPIKITVSDAVVNPNKGYGKDSNDIASENIHLVAEISNTNPYLNEGITVVYKLYVSPKISVRNWQPIENPKFADFWSQNIDIKRLQVENGTYQGEPYRYVVLRKTVLYPQKSGKLKLEPLSLSVRVQVPTSRFDIFGRRLYEDVDKTFSAGEKIINVKPLPYENRPESFTGAVGNFDFGVEVDRHSLKAAESFQVKVQVSGNGNLKLFDLPKIDLPNALEVYAPEHSENVHTNLNGMQGSISDSYTIVPRTQGEYTIPALEFSYFDPNRGTYQTINSEGIAIEVAPNPDALANPGAFANKQAVIASGNQFQYIKLDANLKPIGKNSFFGSTTFWVMLLSPLFAIPIILFIGKKQREKALDVTGNRMRKADKLARKYLSEAKRNLGNQQVFYEALERSLHNYLKAKLHLQTSEMSKEHINRLLHEKGVNEESVNAFIELLKNCEAARYAPSSPTAMQQDYEKAARTVSALDKQL